MDQMKEWPRNHLDLVQSIFPDVASEEEASDMLWNCTAFPLCGNDWLHYHEQLLTLRDTLLSGHEPCEHCGAPATERGKSIGAYETWVCDICWQSCLFDTWRNAPNDTESAQTSPKSPEG